MRKAEKLKIAHERATLQSQVACDRVHADTGRAVRGSRQLLSVCHSALSSRLTST